MRRKPPINWTKSDDEKLEKAIQRFNNKIYRVRHNKPNIAEFQPSTIKKAEKQEIINKFKEMPRSEFNKYLKSLDRYVKKGAENIIQSATGNKVTKWEKREITLKVADINRKRTIERKKIEDLEVTSRGRKTGLTRGEMSSERMNELKPKTFNFDKIKGGKEWELYKKSVLKQSEYNYENEKMERMKDNYLKALENEFGYYSRDTQDKIRQLPPHIVVETYYGEQEASIEFVYDPIEMLTKMDIIHQIWDNKLREYNDR